MDGGTFTNSPRPMDEMTVIAAVEREIASSVGYTADTVVSQQTEALKRYFGEPYGDEKDGSSKMVDRTVMDTVEQAMPSIMRVFATAEKLAQFEPVMPSPDVMPSFDAWQAEIKNRSAQADQATDYCNWMFYEDNPGFIILHDWVKDSLIQKTGVVKMWWDKSREVRFQTFENLSVMQVSQIMQQLPGSEIVEKEEIPGQELTMPDGSVVAGPPNYTVKLRVTRSIGRVKIEGIPPEEFMISRMARSATDLNTTFTCHHTLKSRSELITEGYDPAVVQSLPSGAHKLSQQDNTQRARFNDQSALAESNRTGQNALIEVFECYIRIDQDGDGIAELRQIVYAGHQILRNTEIARCPFYVLCPIRVPHKFYGLSYADMTMDLQGLKTALWRQMLNNLYGTNSPELAIGPGVNIDDTLNRKPRGIIRAEDVNQIKAISIPFTAGESFPMLSYVDEQRRQRTGVAADMGALSPEQLKRVTAEGVSEMMTMARSRPELVARIFAETGIADLFGGMLELVRDNQDSIRVIKLRGGYVPMDPREWDTDMSVKVRIGMGYSSENDQKTALQMVMGLQEKIAAAGGGNGAVTPENIYNTISRLMPLHGLPDITPYFNKPGPPQEGPSAEEKAAMAEIASQERIELAKIQSKERTDLIKIRSQEKVDAAKALMKNALQQEELQKEAELSLIEIATNAKIEQRKSDTNLTRPQ